MNNNFNNTNQDFTLISFINILLSIIAFGYFLLTLVYTLHASKTTKFLVYWLDFSILLTVFLIKSLGQACSVVFKFLIEYMPKVEKPFMIFITQNLVINIVMSLRMIIKLNKIVRINPHNKTPKIIFKTINVINVLSLYSKWKYIIITGIILIINICLSLLVIMSEDIKNLILYLFLVIAIVEIILIKILIKKYCYLYSKDFTSRIIINEILLSKTKGKLCVIIEHFILKSWLDLCLNLDTIIKLSFNIKSPLVIFYFDYIFVLFYSIIVGSSFLSIEKSNKNINISRTLEILFFSNCFHYNFYSKSTALKLFQPIVLDKYLLLRREEDEYSQTLYARAIELDHGSKGTEFTSSFSYYNVNYTSGELGLKKGETNDSKKFNFFPMLKELDGEKNEKEFLPSNFYVLYKLLYKFFKINEDAYLKVEKTVEDEGIPFKKIQSKNNLMFKSENNESLSIVNTLKDNIQRISRISITNKSKLINNYKISLEHLLSTISEKEIKQDFIQNIVPPDYHTNKMNIINENESIDSLSNFTSKEKMINDIQFSIESLLHNDIFELFPFYHINIGDVLNSLDPKNNKDIMLKFSEKKQKYQYFNDYYTQDFFISFEIYEQDFLPFKSLQEFVSNYKAYLMDKLSNFSFSFLPLIIGIFNITYISYNKIVFVYRNSIAFSQFIPFHNWLTFTFNDTDESIKPSVKGNEVVGANQLEEIEVNNNIRLSEDEYNETIKILKEDMQFLKKLNFELNFKLNLFILNYSNQKGDSGISSSLLNTSNDEKFYNALRDTNLFGEGISSNILSNIRNSKKFYNSDNVSLLEKIYLNNDSDKKYVFKIYFSDIFSNNNQIDNKRNENNMNKLLYSQELKIDINKSNNLDKEQLEARNKQYCKLIKVKLIKKIGKTDSSFLSPN